MSRFWSLTVALFGLVIVACTEVPDVDAVRYRCSDSLQCAAGFVCSDLICVPDSSRAIAADVVPDSGGPADSTQTTEVTQECLKDGDPCGGGICRDGICRPADVEPPLEGKCNGPQKLSGRYLVGVALSLGPFTPLSFLATLEVNGTTISMRLKALAFEGNAANLPEGSPVGGEYSASGDIDSTDGSFSLDFGSVVLPGEANLVAPGVAVTTDFVVQGCTSTPTFACGVVTGETSSPFAMSLHGSTWALLPWPDGVGYGQMELRVACP